MFDLDFVKPFSLFDNHFSDLVKAFDNSDFFCERGPAFVDKGDVYELTVPVDEEFNCRNIKVHLDNDNVVCVDYAFKTTNSTKAFTLKETLPEDAVADTLTASFKDYNVVVRVEKKTKDVPKSKEIPIKESHTSEKCTGKGNRRL